MNNFGQRNKRGTDMNRIAVFAATLTLAAGLCAPVMAATSVTIGISGWTGFAPLTLAKQAGLFEKHGANRMSRIA